MNSIYRTDILKATGLVQETLALLDAYQLGQSKEEFRRYVKTSDLLGKATQTRVDNILQFAFYRRYVTAGADIVTSLKCLLANQVSIEVLSQLFLVYTTRANNLLADFIELVYWPKAAAGELKLQTTDPVDFIRDAIADGRIATAWSESTIKKVSEHIIASLIDFRLIEKSKRLTHFLSSDSTINFLLHEGHFRGLTDTQLLYLPDWKVLGLSIHDLIRRINRLAQRGYFISQYSGELLTISWSYSSLLEAANGISRV